MLYYERAIISPSPSPSLAASANMNGSAKHESPYPARNGAINGGYQGIGVGVGTPLDSEETLKPERLTTMSSISVGTQESVTSLDSSMEGGKDKASLPHMSANIGPGSWSGSSLSGSPPVIGARIIRSVTAGRGKRSSSAAPSLNGPAALSTNLPANGSSSTSSTSPLDYSSGSPSLSTTKPIPIPNGSARQQEKAREVDGFERLDYGESSIATRASSLPAHLHSSDSGVSSSLSSANAISPSPSPSDTPSRPISSSPSPSSKRKKQKHKSQTHTTSPTNQHQPPPATVDLKA